MPDFVVQLNSIPLLRPVLLELKKDWTKPA